MANADTCCWQAVLDHLSALNYEREFCGPLGLRPLDPGVNGSSSGAIIPLQYYVELFAWLAACAGAERAPGQKVRAKNVPAADALDDPSEAGALMLQVLKEVGVEEASYVSLKLRTGASDTAPYALKALCDRVSTLRNDFKRAPTITCSSNADALECDDSAEVADDEYENEHGEEDEEKVEIKDQESKAPKQKHQGASDASSSSSAEDKTQEWRLECDRVSAQLHVTIHMDEFNSTNNSNPKSKPWGAEAGNVKSDWRMRHAAGYRLRTALRGAQKECDAVLRHLGASISSDLSKLRSREKNLSEQLHDQLAYLAAATQLNEELKRVYDVQMQAVSRASGMLAEQTELLDDLKTRLDEVGSNMTDSRPLAAIKASVARLRAENSQLDIQTVVLQHTILALRLRAREQAQHNTSGHYYSKNGATAAPVAAQQMR